MAKIPGPQSPPSTPQKPKHPSMSILAPIGSAKARLKLQQSPRKLQQLIRNEHQYGSPSRSREKPLWRDQRAPSPDDRPIAMAMSVIEFQEALQLSQSPAMPCALLPAAEIGTGTGGRTTHAPRAEGSPGPVLGMAFSFNSRSSPLPT